MSIMRKKNIDLITRAALWQSNSKCCFYCGEPILFHDLEIDHIIPESTDRSQLDSLVSSLKLGIDFVLDSLSNLVPTHHSCNARKSDKKFSESSLRYYLELWNSRQQDIKTRIASLRRQALNEKLLTLLASRINQGDLSIFETIAFFEKSLMDVPSRLHEPTVITFGINLSDTNGEPSPKHYDKLESDLLFCIRESIPSLSVMSEPSLRTGETISVRIAFWNLDLNKLDNLPIEPWMVTEIAKYCDIYEENWEDLFPKAVIATYHDVIRERNDPVFGLGRCPQCGSKKLHRSSATDYRNDETYYFIECQKCQWSEWTQ